ncbi:uncharacterized protein LOC100185877 [Ciona intestinalis]
MAAAVLQENVNIDKESDHGFFEIQDQDPAFELDDDVFCEEVVHENREDDVSEQDGISELQQRVIFEVRNRAGTSLSSGFVSNGGAGNSAILDPIFKSANVDGEKPSKSLKKIKDVSSQTDFPICDSVNEDENKTPKVTFRSKSNPEISRNFCWRHDAYGSVVLPSARPTTPISPREHSISASLNTLDSSPVRVNFRHKSCDICKDEENKRIDLKSRKEYVILKKVPAEPSVAMVKNCSPNLLANELPRCSSLWTESRTFYLGADVNTISRPRQNSSLSRRTDIGILKSKVRTLGIQDTYFQIGRHSFHILANKDMFTYGGDRSTEATCQSTANSNSSHSFWIRSVSVSSGFPTPRFPKNNEVPRRKRDWILVQCVTKYTSRVICSAEPMPKLSYHEIGCQEMVLCPAMLRSVEYIEDVCCQHFNKSSKEETLQSGRTVELLFSAKGPVVRDDKHLTGRSIFYFCFDEPLENRRRLCADCVAARAAAPTLTNDNVFTVAQPINSRSSSAKTATLRKAQLSKPARPKTARSNQQPNSQSFRPASATKALVRLPQNKGPACKMLSITTLPANNPQRFTTKSCSINACTQRALKRPVLVCHFTQCTYTLSLFHLHPCIANHSSFIMCSFLTAKEPKDKKKEKSSKQPKTYKDKTSKEDEMKKSVTFADQQSAEVESTTDDKTTDNDLRKRRASLPPPPPRLLHTEEEDEIVGRRRTRRESVAISFGNDVSKPAEEKPAAPKPTAKVKAYIQPEWETIKVTVVFKEEKYAENFLEYKTLQDIYVWLRQALLKSDALTPGAELILAADNLKFPLKANTANHTVASLSTHTFQCEELLQKSKGGGFGETSSRFDTRFSFPIDARMLEGLTPVQYLSKYCIVSGTWRAFYRNVFMQNDRDRDGKITYKELTNAMERLFVELAHPIMQRVLFLMGADPLSSKPEYWDRNSFVLPQRPEPGQEKLKTWQKALSIDSETFVSLCALANRIICREKQIEGIPVDEIIQTNNHLEDADFYNIEQKLKECKLEPLTKRLLLYIRK